MSKMKQIGEYAVTLSREGIELHGRTYEYAELTPKEALELLAWLFSEQETLEQLAKGDSVTDDTAAIQLAVNQGESQFASGTYIVSKKEQR